MNAPGGDLAQADADDPFGLIGTTIAGRYRVDALVGEGGFGIIYRGFHTGFERPIAIKCLKIPPYFSARAREIFWQRFREEGKLLAQLSEHPSIVRVFDVASSTTGGGAPVPYLVLEWLAGKNLEQLIAERARTGAGPYSEAEALALLRPVVDAIRVAHAHGIAHRDLKPANLFMASGLGGAALKVLDFGIAKVMQAGEVASEGALNTSSGVGAFSPPYGAPEQFVSARFGPSGPWTDVHGLGLILTELVTGRRALSSATPAELLEDALRERRPTPAERGARPSPALEALCARALALEPRDRFPDAGALLAALDAVASGATPAQAAAQDATPRTAEPPPANASLDTRDFLAAQAAAHDATPRTAGTPPASASLDTRDFLSAQALEVPRDAPPPTVGARPLLPATSLGPAGDHTETGTPRVFTERDRATTAPFEPKGMTAVMHGSAPDPRYPAVKAAAPARRPWTILAGGGLLLIVGGVALGLAVSRGDASGPSAPSGSAGAASPGSTPAPVVQGPDDTVLVAGGEFTMGCTSATAGCPDEEKPAHAVRLAAYYLDRTEVTVEAYRRCVQSGACTAPATISSSCNASHDDRADHPVNCVDWAQADAYCRWAGKRLPTEAEWEKAARGTDGRSYPWGDTEPTCERAVLRNVCGGESTSRVGSRPSGAGPYGALDLVGNVREWVADGYQAGFYAGSPGDNPMAPPGPEHVTRGGSFRDMTPQRGTTRDHWKAALPYIGIGMRCARAAP